MAALPIYGCTRQHSQPGSTVNIQRPEHMHLSLRLFPAVPAALLNMDYP